MYRMERLAQHLVEYKKDYGKNIMYPRESQGGLVVINRASHLCDPGSILASGRMWAEFQSIST